MQEMAGYRLIKKSLSWNEEEKEAMQHATVAAAMAQVADVKEAEQEDASTVAAIAANAEEVVVLELWSG